MKHCDESENRWVFCGAYFGRASSKCASRGGMKGKLIALFTVYVIKVSLMLIVERKLQVEGVLL